MAVEYRFMKNFVFYPDDVPPSTQQMYVKIIPETLIASADDEDLVTVAYNGQLIQRRTTESASSFAKYYFELTRDIGSYDPDNLEVGVESSASFTVSIYANENYRCPGFDSGDSQVVRLSNNDVIFISFWHTIVREL